MAAVVKPIGSFTPEKVQRRKEWLRRFWDPSQPIERHAVRRVRSSRNPQVLDGYEQRLREFIAYTLDHDNVDDDHVPTWETYVGATQQASAFGCKIVRFGEDQPWALPVVEDYDPEAVMALELPPEDAGQLGESLDLTRRFEEDFEGLYPVRIADMQGPGDIAGQVWKDEHFFRSLIEHPEAAHHLISLATELLIRFARAQRAACTELTGCHCPHVWMPPESGVGLSEDYAPVLSPEQYEEFSLPYVNRISRELGGVFIHCCGDFAHQLDNFERIENLRGIHFTPPEVDWRPVVERFADRCVLIPTMSYPTGPKVWKDVGEMNAEILSGSPPEARLWLWE